MITQQIPFYGSGYGDLSDLKRRLDLGAQHTPPLVDRVPHIPMLKENNTRKGFFEHDEFIALRNVLPDHLKGFVTFAYRTGWRLTEIATIKWSQGDRRSGIVSLEVGETKNDEARRQSAYLDSRMGAISGTIVDLQRKRANRDDD